MSADTPTLQEDPALRRLADRIASARADRKPLCIRGGGTKDFYGEPPRGEPLTMHDLRGISSYLPSELVITARAGTLLAEVEEALARHGQCLAFEPPRLGAGGGTVGGMVAAGLSGPSRATVGCVRDYVLGVTMLNGLGETLSFGGQVIKNVAGYDVSRLMAGSMGVLGVICEVSLKAMPIAPARRTLRFELDEARTIAQLNAWAGRPLPLNAGAWRGGTLLVRLAGARAAVDAACRTLGGETVDAGAADTLWEAMRDQRDDFFARAADPVARGATLWRISVPQTTPPLGLAGDSLVDWCGAQRWLVSTQDAAAIRAAALRAGGHATRYRGGDPSVGAFAPLAAPLDRIHRELKRAFDPDGILNPGRMYASL